MINLNFEIHWIGEDNCSIFQWKSATELTELSVKHVQTSSNVDAIFFSTKKHDNRHLDNRKALSIRGFRFVSKQFYILDFWIVRNGCFLEFAIFSPTLGEKKERRSVHIDGKSIRSARIPSFCCFARRSFRCETRSRG